jgi:L-threonylcarbamoyladenylate synthase
MNKYAGHIKDGDVLLFPTDTVMGIGCRFDSGEGIARLRAIKEIKESVPIAVLISSIDQLEKLKIRRSRLSNILISRFWPGGLTIVLSSEKHYPCCGDGNTIGLRMPDFDLLRRIIEKAGVPLAATSANLHGKPPPKIMEDVEQSIVERVDCSVDLTTRIIGLPSTVVKLEAGEPRILREGAVSSGEIYEALEEAV